MKRYSTHRVWYLTSHKSIYWYKADEVDADKAKDTTRIKKLEKLIRHKDQWLRIIRDDAKAHCLKGYVEMADMGLKH